MAYTKIWAIKTSAKKSLEYIMNPEKTEDGLLVSGYECEPTTAYVEFALMEKMAEDVKGKKVTGIHAYHMLQSFSPEDQVTPEQAHELGKQLADQLLGGGHQYVISTHVDKEHIHNHIVFCSTNMNTYQKFRTKPFVTARKIRAISDRLCAEHELSVIKDPQKKGLRYEEWQDARTSDFKEYMAELRRRLTFASRSSYSFEEYIQNCESLGVIVDPTRRNISYNLVGSAHRNVRGDKLDDSGAYTRSELEEHLAVNRENRGTIERLVWGKIEEIIENMKDTQEEALLQKYKSELKMEGIEMRFRRQTGVAYFSFRDAETGDDHYILGHTIGIDTLQDLKELLQGKERKKSNASLKDLYEQDKVIYNDDAEYIHIPRQCIKNRIGSTFENEKNKYVKKEINKYKNPGGVLLQLGDQQLEIFISGKQLKSEEEEIYAKIKEDIWYDVSMLQGESKISAQLRGSALIQMIEDYREESLKSKQIEFNVPVSQIRYLSPKGLTLELDQGGTIFVKAENVRVDRARNIVSIQERATKRYNYIKQENGKKEVRTITAEQLRESMMYAAQHKVQSRRSMQSRIIGARRIQIRQELKDTLMMVEQRKEKEIGDLKDYEKVLQEQENKIRKFELDIQNKLKVIDEWKKVARLLYAYDGLKHHIKTMQELSEWKKRKYIKKNFNEIELIKRLETDIKQMGYEPESTSFSSIMESIRQGESDIRSLQEAVKTETKELQKIEKGLEVFKKVFHSEKVDKKKEDRKK